MFGVSPLTGSRITNCEQCHYVHFSMFGEYSDLNNLWYGCSLMNCNLKNNEREPMKNPSFFERIREEKNIFSTAVNVEGFKKKTLKLFRMTLPALIGA